MRLLGDRFGSLKNLILAKSNILARGPLLNRSDFNQKISFSITGLMSAPLPLEHVVLMYFNIPVLSWVRTLGQ